MCLVLHLGVIVLNERAWWFVSAAVFMCLVGVGLVAFRKRLKMGNFFPILFLSISLLFATFVALGIWFRSQFE